MSTTKTSANMTTVVIAIAVTGALAMGCGASVKRPTTPLSADDAPKAVSKQAKGPLPTNEEAARVDHVMSSQVKRLYNDGVRMLAEGDLDSAESLFSRALELDEKAVLAAYNLGVVADRRGDGSEAAKYYRLALRLQPDHVPALHALVALHARVGTTDEAVVLAGEAARRLPDDGGVLLALADAHIAAEQYAAAIATAKLALTLDERDPQAILRIGVANFHMGRLELAGAIFEQVESIDPSAARVYFFQALIALDEERPLTAIDLLKKAIEKDPAYVEAMNNLAVEYLLAGNYTDALSWLERAVALSPARAGLHLNYGNALRGAGRWPEAKRALERANQLDSNLPGTFFNLGVLYYVAGDLDELDRLGRLSEAKRLFALYKSAQGAALTKDDEVHKYLREVQLAMEREETRVEQAAERERIEAERARQREAGEGAVDAEESDEDGWEEDDGWE